MDISPEFSEFSANYNAGRPQCVWARRVADTETPVSAMLKVGLGDRASFLLESVEGGSVRGRYSMIGLHPDLLWQSRGNRSEIARDALNAPDSFEPCAGDALAELRQLIDSCRMDVPEALPKALSVLVGYMSYETTTLVERLPQPKGSALGLPDLFFLRPTVLLVFDRL